MGIDFGGRQLAPSSATRKLSPSPVYSTSPKVCQIHCPSPSHCHSCLDHPRPQPSPEGSSAAKLNFWIKNLMWPLLYWKCFSVPHWLELLLKPRATDIFWELPEFYFFKISNPLRSGKNSVYSFHLELQIIKLLPYLSLPPFLNLILS